MKIGVLFLLSFVAISSISAQNVGIGTSTPDASAQLDISTNNKGLLIPRLALTSSSDAITITSPATSLLVYNLGTGGLSPAGYYYNNGSPGTPSWVQLVSSGTVWSLTGNIGTVDGTHFIGTTDNVPLTIKVNNQQAGKIWTTATNNTFLGLLAGNSNAGGYNNTAVGANSLVSNVAKSMNTAIGTEAMRYYNNGINVSITGNTALGHAALRGGFTPANNTGIFNTAVGYFSIQENTTGENNTAIGTFSMESNRSGANNTVLGYGSLFENISGGQNTAIGLQALYQNLAGSGNVALGYQAGFNESSSNKLYIENSNANKDNALIYGDFAADSLLLNAKTINKFSLNVRGSNALEIGYGTAGKQTDAGKLCYGCFGDPPHWLGIVGGGQEVNGGTDRVIKLWSEGGLRIRGNALPNTDNGYSLGQSGLRWSSVWAVSGTINTSDANLKTNIKATQYGLKEILQMQPVEYNWKEAPGEDKQIGFLAQDILKIIPEAVVVPKNGDPMGMKYNELIPVLVKAIQEQQKQIEELKKLLLKNN